MSTRPVRRLSEHGVSLPSEREEFFLAIKELAALALRRWALIAVFAAVFTTAALAFVWMRVPAYSSTARVLLDPRGLNIIADQVVPQSPSSDVNDAVIDTEIGLLSSDAVMRATVKACELQRDPSFVAQPGLLARIESSLGLRSEAAAVRDPVELAAEALHRRITVQRDGKSFVVSIIVQADTPAKAIKIASAVAKSFLVELVAQRRDLVSRTQSAMEGTLGGQRDRVAQAETAVERYKTGAGIVDADGRTLNLASIAQLDTQIVSAHALAAALSAKLAQLETMRRRPDQMQDVSSPLLTQLQASRTEIARQQANLSASLGPRHPQLLEVNAQLTTLDRAIAAEIERLTAAARTDYLSAVNRERSLVADRGRLQNKIAGANTALVGMRQLEREADAQRDVYQKFLVREQELRQQATLTPVDSTLIAEPTVPDAPVGLKPGFLVAASLMLGLLVGIFVAWAVERSSGKIFSAARLSAKTGLPIFGVIPLSMQSPDERPALVCALADGRGTSTSRVIQRLADTLDRIGASSSLLVVSATDHGAATVVASGVVISAAASGHRALLVEAAAQDDPHRLASQLEIRPGAVAACQVEDYPVFDIERLGSILSPGALEKAKTSWFSSHDHVVLDVGPSAQNATVRKLVEAVSAVVILVEFGISTFADVELLHDMIDANDMILGLLIVTRGKDPTRVLPARVVSGRLAPELPLALRPYRT